MNLPNHWELMSTGDVELLYGLYIDLSEISYNFVVTDLSRDTYWCESVERREIIQKMDDMGLVDMDNRTKLQEFLRLLEKKLNKVKMIKDNNDHEGDVPMISMRESMAFNLNDGESLTWPFRTNMVKDSATALSLDVKMKYQLFNVIAIHNKLNAELRRQIGQKDRIIQTLVENFLELNNSFSSSIEDDETGLVDFAKRVSGNKELERIFPSSGSLRKSLMAFQYDNFLDRLKQKDLTDETTSIWSQIGSSIGAKSKNIWDISNEYNASPSSLVQAESNCSTATSSYQQQEHSEFVDLDEIIKREQAMKNRAGTTSPKKRRLNTTPEAPSVRSNNPVGAGTGTRTTTGVDSVITPSPVKNKTFGVIGGGGDSTNRKRKLKAGSSSPIKAPRLM